MRTNELPQTSRRAGEVLTAVYNKTDDFFGVGNIIESTNRGFSYMERIAKTIETFMVNAVRAYSDTASISGQFSDILQSSADVSAINVINAINSAGAFIGNGYASGGKFFSADRKGIDKDGSVKRFPFELDINREIAVVSQYIAALEAARGAALDMIERSGDIVADADSVSDNTGGAYDIILSFGRLPGGSAAVALASLGNSVVWLQKLYADSIASIGNSTVAFADLFGGMGKDPLSIAMAKYILLESFALPAIGSVTGDVGSITSAALPRALDGSSQNSISDSLSGMFFGGNSSILENIFLNSIFSVVNGVSSEKSLFSTKNIQGLSNIFGGGGSSILENTFLNSIFSVVNGGSSEKSLFSTKNIQGLSNILFGSGSSVLENSFLNSIFSVVNEGSSEKSLSSTKYIQELSSILFGGGSSVLENSFLNSIFSVVNGGSSKKSLSYTKNMQDLSSILFGGDSPILENSFFNGISLLISNKNGMFSNGFVRYVNASAADYLIGDILKRSAGIACKSGDSYTKINNANSKKLMSGVSIISENVGTADSTAEISAEDLKFLRDTAAMDVINRFTTAQVSVSMGGVTNNLSGTTDLDSFVSYLVNGVKTAMENAAEGVHS